MSSTVKSYVLQDVLQWWHMAQTTELSCSTAGQVLDQAADGQHDTRGTEEGERCWLRYPQTHTNKV